ncbi:MAG: PepSY-associated TM helix domain-containing protein [Heteroscytonema crispum UTEX LB 1556]
MKPRKFHDFAFMLHRYIGFAVGLPIVFISLTGSLLVFKPEIEQLLIAQNFGHIQPQPQMVSIDAVLATAKSELVNRPELTLNSIRLPSKPSSPYQIDLFDPTDQLTRLFIHPYTGKIMGWMESDSSIERVLLKLHYGLLSGRRGEIIVGIIGLLLFILSITGLILWTGWRNLIAGFKIKWNGHFKRVNFDIHKVTGIVTILFLSMTAFTGFCWNFSDWSYPVIYATTFTHPAPEIASTPIPGQTPLPISKLLQNSNTVFPATTFSISIPAKPTDVVSVRKRQPHETLFYGQSDIILDSYSGEILRVVDSKTLPLGDSIITSFEPLHYGTFWGILSRIIYIFVGLAPLILLITSLAMYQYPNNKKLNNKTSDSVTRS